MLGALCGPIGGRTKSGVGGSSAQGGHGRDEQSCAGEEERERRKRRRKREDGREWYITSKLVQVEDDQIATRVINRSAVLSCESQTGRVIIISTLSTTLCSVTGKMLSGRPTRNAFEKK